LVWVIWLLFALTSSAQDESAIVGFVRLKLDAGLHLIGIPLSGETNGVPLEESFATQLRGGNNAATADQVGLYEAESDEAQMLWKDDSGQFRDANGEGCTAAVTAGSGFWLELRGPREILFVGELKTDNAVGVTIEPGVQIISAPLPMHMALSDITAAVGAVTATKPEEADQLGVYDRATGQLRWAWLSPDGWRSLDGEELSVLDSPLSATEGYVYVHRGDGFVLKKAD
jgi:hypothetical protein